MIFMPHVPYLVLVGGGRSRRRSVPILGPGRARHFVDTESDNMIVTAAIGSAPWSIACWIKTTDTTQYCMGLYDATDQGRLALLITAAGLARAQATTDAGGSVATAVDSSEAVNDGAWHFIATALAASDYLYLWVDGVAQTPQASGATLPTPANIALGMWNNVAPYNGQYYLGDIDEASVWVGHKLTTAEALALTTLGNDNTKQYFLGSGSFGDATVTVPTHHYSLSVVKNPLAVGTDEVGTADLTDNGTADVEGIPAGD